MNFYDSVHEEYAKSLPEPTFFAVFMANYGALDYSTLVMLPQTENDVLLFIDGTRGSFTMLEWAIENLYSASPNFVTALLDYVWGEMYHAWCDKDDFYHCEECQKLADVRAELPHLKRDIKAVERKLDMDVIPF